MISYYENKTPTEVLVGTGCIEQANAICARWACTLAEVEGQGRRSNVCQARHAIWQMLVVDRGLAAISVARIFKRDHTSILYALKKVHK